MKSDMYKLLAVMFGTNMADDVMEYRNDLTVKYSKAYALNDSAHRESHFDEVFMNCIKIHEVMNIELDLSDLLQYMAAAYFHDMFAWSRDNHHLLSQAFVKTSTCELISFFNDVQRARIALMCGEHRATFTGDFGNVWSERFNAADLGAPESVGSHVARAIKYHMDRNECSYEQAAEVAKQHIKDKYGRDGYGRMSDVYKEVWGSSLEKFYQEIEAL